MIKQVAYVIATEKECRNILLIDIYNSDPDSEQQSAIYNLCNMLE